MERKVLNVEEPDAQATKKLKLSLVQQQQIVSFIQHMLCAAHDANRFINHLSDAHRFD